MKNLLYGRIGKCIIVIWEMLERGHIRSCFFGANHQDFLTLWIDLLMLYDLYSDPW